MLRTKMRWTVPIERLAVLTAHEAEVKRTSGIAKLQSALKAAGAIWTSGVIRSMYTTYEPMDQRSRL